MSRKEIDNNSKRDHQQSSTPKRKFSWWWIYIVLLIAILVPYSVTMVSPVSEITWKQFETDILSRNAVDRIVIVNSEKAELYIKEEFANDPQFKSVFTTRFGKSINAGPHYFLTLGSVELFERKLDELQKNVPVKDRIDLSYSRETSWLPQILTWIFPLFLLIALWSFLLRRNAGMGAGGGSSLFNFSKSTATLVEKESSNTSFDDVAGLEEAEMEVKEIVDFLKNPQVFTKLGAKIPKGVILVGPP